MATTQSRRRGERITQAKAEPLDPRSSDHFRVASGDESTETFAAFWRAK